MGFAVGVVLKGSHNKFSSKQTVTYKCLYGNRLSEVKDDTLSFANSPNESFCGTRRREYLCVNRREGDTSICV